MLLKIEVVVIIIRFFTYELWNIYIYLYSMVVLWAQRRLVIHQWAWMNFQKKTCVGRIYSGENYCTGTIQLSWPWESLPSCTRNLYNWRLPSCRRWPGVLYITSIRWCIPRLLLTPPFVEDIILPRISLYMQ